MNILAIDPSFRALSYSYCTGKKIYLDTISYPLGKGIGFEKIYDAVHVQWEQFNMSIGLVQKTSKSKIDVVVSEIPPPIGTFSAGLYALDAYVLHNLFNTYKSIKELYVVSPSYLTSIHGTRKYKKKESTELARHFIEDVLKDYEVIIPDSISEKTGRKTKGKLNNDKAESFIFLLRMMCKFNIRNKRSVILKHVSAFEREHERLLCAR